MWYVSKGSYISHKQRIIVLASSVYEHRLYTEVEGSVFLGNVGADHSNYNVMSYPRRWHYKYFLSQSKESVFCIFHMMKCFCVLTHLGRPPVKIAVPGCMHLRT